jgi:hypothetical protein
VGQPDVEADRRISPHGNEFAADGVLDVIEVGLQAVWLGWSLPSQLSSRGCTSKGTALLVGWRNNVNACTASS